MTSQRESLIVSTLREKSSRRSFSTAFTPQFIVNGMIVQDSSEFFYPSRRPSALLRAGAWKIQWVTRRESQPPRDGSMDLADALRFSWVSLKRRRLSLRHWVIFGPPSCGHEVRRRKRNAGQIAAHRGCFLLLAMISNRSRSRRDRWSSGANRGANRDAVGVNSERDRKSDNARRRSQPQDRSGVR
jgi:hypothetical protein